MEGTPLQTCGDWAVYRERLTDGSHVYNVGPSPALADKDSAYFACTDADHAARLVKELADCVAYECGKA